MASKHVIKVIMRSAKSAYFYVTKRNKKANKLALRGFDPVVREQVDFAEEKMK
ncbi:MAG: 50S ribosomal protein L33 [Pseudomonadota bacterium]